MSTECLDVNTSNEYVTVESVSPAQKQCDIKFSMFMSWYQHPFSVDISLQAYSYLFLSFSGFDPLGRQHKLE